LLNLILHTLFCIGFGLVVKHAQHQGLRLLPVGAVNYLLAAVVTGVWACVAGLPEFRTPVLGTGVFAGVVYVVAFLFLIFAVRSQGISTSSAIVRLSQLLPVVYAMACWGERMSGWQVFGLGLFCLAAPLLVNLKNSHADQLPAARSVMMLTFLFIVTGLCGVATKRFDGIGTPEERELFLFLLFGTTAAVSAGLLLRGRILPTVGELRLGVFLGLSNVLGNFFLLLALRDLGGTIVFPVASAGTIIITTALAILCWKEAVSRKGLWGIAVSSAAVVFLNLK